MKNKREEFKGLDETQMGYGMVYSLEKDELQYRDFEVKTQKMEHPNSFGMPQNHTTTACCREHAKDQFNDVISVSL